MANKVLDKLYPVKEWTRDTVADGALMSKNTITPLINRTNLLEEDLSDFESDLQDVIDDIGDTVGLEAGPGISIDKDIDNNKIIISSTGDSTCIFNISDSDEISSYTYNSETKEYSTDLKLIAKLSNGILVENGNWKLDSNKLYTISWNVSLTVSAKDNPETITFKIMPNTTNLVNSVYYGVFDTVYNHSISAVNTDFVTDVEQYGLKIIFTNVDNLSSLPKVKIEKATIRCIGTKN